MPKRESPKHKRRPVTPTFLLELPLTLDASRAKVFHARFEAGRQLYNALVHEALTRLNRMRSSAQWQTARTLPRHLKQERAHAFSKLRAQFGFREYDLHQAATKLNVHWLRDHLDANTAQKLASRAFHAVNRLCLGKAKHIRFKSKGQGIGSLEGKTNLSGIRFVLQDTKEGNDGHLIWGTLKVPTVINWRDPVVHYGLGHRVKYVRIVRRNASSTRAKGADQFGQRYAVQLILEGRPHQKPMHTVGTETIGIDLGPSSVAWVSQDGEAHLEPLAAKLHPNARARRRLQRKLERQRRANNPQNYDQRGRVKRGHRLQWKDSHAYQRTRRRLACAERKLAAHRKALHGRLCHEILMVGKHIHIEKTCLRGWQKTFGKSVGLHAPGMLRERLKRLAASADGSWREIPTQTTRLSQYCHQCGRYEKKSLSERWHRCACGIGPVQRDLYAAFLLAHIRQDNPIPSISQRVWQGVELRLKSVMEDFIQRARRGESFPSCMGVPRDRARRSESLDDLPQEPVLLWKQGRLEAWQGPKNHPGF